MVKDIAESNQAEQLPITASVDSDKVVLLVDVTVRSFLTRIHTCNGASIFGVCTYGGKAMDGYILLA
ncbi:MAG: hypothetical protein HXS47_11225 [Theionarchaea archaeon]|nr:hypothetical protein [Theionarchaea archaeon]